MKKRFLSIPLVALCIVWIVLFNACSNKKIGSDSGNERELMSWTIVFKPDATNKQIALTLGELDNYILNYVNPRDESKQAKIGVFNISHTINFEKSNNGIIVETSVDLRAMGGGKIKGGPIPPPKRDLFTVPEIFNIKSH